MYCSQCGNRIDEQAKFCARCGSRIAADQRANNQADYTSTVQTVDKVLWVFQGQRKLSMLKTVPCYLVFTQDKVVLAHVTPALRKAESARVSQQVKAEGKGFFKGSARMIRFWADYYKKYYTMPIHAILAEEPSNIVIDNPVITRVYFKGYSETISTGETAERRVIQGKFELGLANKETIKFTHAQPAHKSIKELLTNLFGKRLKYRK